MRIAWLGPSPDLGGGVPEVGGWILGALADRGHHITCFVAPGPVAPPERLLAHPGLTWVTAPRRWRWNRWYSRGGASFLTALSEPTSRAHGQLKLVGDLVRRHKEEPFDVLLQHSQPELLALRRWRHELPPIVLHPQVHAAGELRWHRREAEISRSCEPRARRLAVRTLLTARSVAQRHDGRSVSLVVAASERFADDLRRDHGLQPHRVVVVPNPVDLTRFTLDAAPSPPDDGLREVLYVARFSVRKGLESVVELTHRLADLRGRVRVRIVGHPSLWSDYSRLLAGVNPEVAFVEGQVSARDMPARYARADVLVQPSHYEPFGLTVAEALASGRPVVVTDVVGAAEHLPASCCTRVPDGDPDAFERAIREVLGRDAVHLAATACAARSEAERRFSPEAVASRLERALEAASR